MVLWFVWNCFLETTAQIALACSISLCIKRLPYTVVHDVLRWIYITKLSKVVLMKTQSKSVKPSIYFIQTR